MASALAERAGFPAVSVMSLEDLARVANEAHQQVDDSLASAVQYAVRVGEALEAAKRVYDGNFDGWLQANFFGGRGKAYRYMRLYAYREQIPKEGGVVQALEAISGLPRNQTSTPAAVLRQAREMKADGKSQGEIARHFGVTKQCVSSWFNERSKRRNARSSYQSQRAARARAALRREEQAQAVRQRGGRIAEVYSLLRKATQEAERAQAASRKPEMRASLNEAITKLYEATDSVLAGLGIE